MNGPDDERRRLAPWIPITAAMLAGIILVALVHRDFGVTWDEGVQAQYGQGAVKYFASGLRDTSCNEIVNLRLYGPLPEMIPALFHRGADDDPARFDTRHLVHGLLALLIIPFVAVCGRRLERPWVAIAAVVAIVLMPRFVGHAFNNSKDVPFTIAVTWFMLATASLAASGSYRWRDVVHCGVAMGAALCVRPGGLPPLLVYFFGMFVIAGLTRGRGTEALAPSVGGPRRLLAAWGIAWACMVIPWPWAHEQPFLHPLLAMGESVGFSTTYPVLYGGEVISSDALPRDYLARMLLITTPLPVLLLAAVGCVACARSMLARGRAATMHGALLLWVAVPVIGVAVTRPNVYDGLRHFLFVLPAVALLAAVGASALIAFATSARAQMIVGACVAAGLLWPVVPMVRLHPYEVTYYNALVGGVGGAADSYETDYWISSYREAMAWIEANADPAAENESLLVVAGGSWFVHDAALPRQRSDIEVMASAEFQAAGLDPQEIDYTIETTRAGWGALVPDAPVVHEIGREGAVFARVRRP